MSVSIRNLYKLLIVTLLSANMSSLTYAQGGDLHYTPNIERKERLEHKVGYFKGHYKFSKSDLQMEFDIKIGDFLGIVGLGGGYAMIYNKTHGEQYYGGIVAKIKSLYIFGIGTGFLGEYKLEHYSEGKVVNGAYVPYYTEQSDIDGVITAITYDHKSGLASFKENKSGKITEFDFIQFSGRIEDIFTGIQNIPYYGRLLKEQGSAVGYSIRKGKDDAPSVRPSEFKGTLSMVEDGTITLKSDIGPLISQSGEEKIIVGKLDKNFGPLEGMIKNLIKGIFDVKITRKR